MNIHKVYILTWWSSLINVVHSLFLHLFTIGLKTETQRWYICLKAVVVIVFKSVHVAIPCYKNTPLQEKVLHSTLYIVKVLATKYSIKSESINYAEWPVSNLLLLLLLLLLLFVVIDILICKQCFNVIGQSRVNVNYLN